MTEPKEKKSSSQRLSKPPVDAIGILGGTFDPVHKGHIHLASIAMQAFGLSKVLLVPTSIPPHKLTADIAPVEDRLAMLRLAIADKPNLEISTVELDRGGVSYTVDTLRALTKAFPQTDFRLIFGADMLPELHKWKEVEEVLRLGHPIAATRPGWDFNPENGEAIEAFKEILNPSLHKYAKLLSEGLLKLPPYDVSSSTTRAYVANEVSGRIANLLTMLPETVLDYILEKGLYRKQSAGGETCINHH